MAPMPMFQVARLSSRLRIWYWDKSGREPSQREVAPEPSVMDRTAEKTSEKAGERVDLGMIF